MQKSNIIYLKLRNYSKYQFLILFLYTIEMVWYQDFLIPKLAKIVLNNKKTTIFSGFMVRLRWFEHPTYRLGGDRSILLSYSRKMGLVLRLNSRSKLRNLLNNILWNARNFAFFWYQNWYQNCFFENVNSLKVPKIKGFSDLILWISIHLGGDRSIQLSYIHILSFLCVWVNFWWTLVLS